MLMPFARESVTIDNTVGGVALTVATFAPGGYKGNAYTAQITCEGGDFRFTVDGTAPTTTLGEFRKRGNVLTLENPKEIAKFKAIRTGTLSATLEVVYYRKG